jgi:hypothetical protein
MNNNTGTVENKVENKLNEMSQEKKDNIQSKKVRN